MGIPAISVAFHGNNGMGVIAGNASIASTLQPQ